MEVFDEALLNHIAACQHLMTAGVCFVLVPAKPAGEDAKAFTDGRFRAAQRIVAGEPVLALAERPRVHAWKRMDMRDAICCKTARLCGRQKVSYGIPP